MDLSTQLVDPFVTLWFLLMHPLVDFMFAFFLLGTLLMLIYLHKLSNSAHIFMIILSFLLHLLRHDWEKWKEAIPAELNCLAKREVFGPVVPTPENVKPVGYWVFVRKRNENNEIVRYKARLVAQGFSQRPDIDYAETYSPVMDAITFRYLIHLAVLEGLEMHLMDVVTAYLYGSIDSDIYMKIPEGFTLPEAKF